MVTGNLGDLLDRAKPPDALALIDCLDWDRPRESTHGELDRLARACARAVRARGLARGDAVAILAANRVEFLVAYLGVMRAGLVAVPVNIRFPRETIDFVMRDSRVTLVFCDQARRALVPPDIPTIDFDEDFGAFLDPGDFATVTPEAGETAMVLYTSGSTGRPKGVPLSHDGQRWAVMVRATVPGVDRQRLLVAAPLFHMNGLGTVKVALAGHASIVLLPQFDARRYIEAIGRFRVTRLTSVPTMLAMIVRERETLAKTDLSSVQTVMTGSAPLAQKLVDDVTATFPRATFGQGYGTTEAGPLVFGAHAGGRPAPAIALGWVRPNVEVRLVGPDGADADEGVLWMRTPATMRGYLNLPEKTREVLTPDGWYISGDIVRRDADGLYFFVGRADDMFVCGGENVFPGDVETMLESHPDILQAAVVPVPDDIKGEKPFAFVVARAGHAPTEDDVKRYALAKAPAYQHPRRVVFLDELPMAGTNKIDRAALRQRALALWNATEKIG
jgi:acyl-CoA synthetase (AMP-forming)/AMP-acid ligase II